MSIYIGMLFMSIYIGNIIDCSTTGLYLDINILDCFTTSYI